MTKVSIHLYIASIPIFVHPILLTACMPFVIAVVPVNLLVFICAYAALPISVGVLSWFTRWMRKSSGSNVSKGFEGCAEAVGTRSSRNWGLEEAKRCCGS